MPLKRILVINLGSTSTKVAIYEDRHCVAETTIRHSAETLLRCPLAGEQVTERAQCIAVWLTEQNTSVTAMDALAIRGCIFRGGESGGTYLVTDALARQVYSQYVADQPPTHAARLTLAVALALLGETTPRPPIYITDPPSVNELIPEARIAGHPLFERKSVFHALNSKAVGYHVAEQLGKAYKDCNFIVAHMGGGVSVSAHQNGKVIEVNDCFFGGGPISPDRSGTLPVGQLIELCFSGKYDKREVKLMAKGKGGIFAHLGTADMREVEARMDAGNEKAALLYRTMAYQIAKEIGACYAALSCKTDGIILTGGIAYSDRMIDLIRQRVEPMAPVYLVPGERENEALAMGALRVLNETEKAIVL